MSTNTRRRDSRNRILRTGESQRKDGRYAYRYKDNDGTIRTVYSWKLDVKDKTPKGKKNDVSLREKEREINSKLSKGIRIKKGDITVSELVYKYLSKKQNTRATTKSSYKVVFNAIKADSLGDRRITSIKTSEMKEWFLQKNETWKFGTLTNIKSVLKLAFQMALEEDLIVKNPFDFKLSAVIENDNDDREALTPYDEERFLEFVKDDPRFSPYYDGIYILFNTGLRISEFAGLTVSDVDVKNRRVKIERQLLYVSGTGFVLQPPKTKNGIRIIPITNDVCECFQRIIASRNVKKEPIINGKSGFLYITSQGNPMNGSVWAHLFKRMVKVYNIHHGDDELPPITPHICRHTYCTRKAAEGINMQVLQYLMGHSNITTTFNIYTHLRVTEAEAELNKLYNELR